MLHKKADIFRNVGMGFTWFMNAIMGLTGPHFIALAKINKAIPYIGLSVISLFSTLTASFLPETLGVSLPETIKESAELGADQKYFSIKSTHGNVQKNQNNAAIHE